MSIPLVATVFIYLASIELANAHSSLYLVCLGLTTVLARNKSFQRCARHFKLAQASLVSAKPLQYLHVDIVLSSQWSSLASQI